MPLQKVGAIILTWNNYNDTMTTYKNIKHQEFEGINPIIVDNGSTNQDHIKKLKKSVPSEDILLLDENKGFAAGMNAGIRELGEMDYYLLLNNDIVLTENLVENLVNEYESSGETGIISPQILNLNDNTVWFERGTISKYTAEAKHTKGYSEDADIVENDYIPFCCALVPKEVIRSIGDLNEDYFMYYEDVDYAIRCEKKGFSVMTSLETSIKHGVSDSSGGVLGKLYSYYRIRNSILLYYNFRRYFSSLFWLFIPLITLKEIAVRIAFGKLGCVLAILEGFTAGLKNVNGKGPYP